MDAQAKPPLTALRRPLRVLHVLAGMNRGGLETYLMNVMRRIDRSRYHFTFCTHTRAVCDYDEEIRSLGGEIVPCVFSGSLRRFYSEFSRVLREGAYDVVHAHAYQFAGFVLHAASRRKMVHRFAHLHTTGDGKTATLMRGLYRNLTRLIVHRYATRVFGCSRSAFEAFFGRGWEADPRYRVLYYGIHLEPFHVARDREGVRQELKLPANTPMVIHVGRFDRAKNHPGLIRIFAELHRRRPELHLVLVGAGGESGVRETTVQIVQEEGLESCVHFLGVRSDVARLMKAADVMVMPSIREGMPVTLLEATAAGLPVVITDMPGMREANAECCRARLLPVDAPTGVWADAVLEALAGEQPDAEEAFARVARSPFSSERAAQMLQDEYDRCLPVYDGAAVGRHG